MGIFSRLFGIGQANANAVIDKMEDPIKMTEQGIRDLKKDFDSAVTALATIKALAIRTKRDFAEAEQLSADYNRKATLLLARGKSGDLDMAEADRLATEALTKAEVGDGKVASLEKTVAQQDAKVAQVQQQVDSLSKTIKQYENDLITLKARSTTASAVKKINKQMAAIDSSSTVAMLNRMKERVEEDEALGEAYGQIAEKPADTDAEINKALASGSNSSASSRLTELKAKMGITETAGTTA
jgi:phage shock protein A